MLHNAKKFLNSFLLRYDIPNDWPGSRSTMQRSANFKAAFNRAPHHFDSSDPEVIDPCNHWAVVLTLIYLSRPRRSKTVKGQ